MFVIVICHAEVVIVICHAELDSASHLQNVVRSRIEFGMTVCVVMTGCVCHAEVVIAICYAEVVIAICHAELDSASHSQM